MSLLLKILVPVIVLGIGVWALMKNQSTTPPPEPTAQVQQVATTSPQDEAAARAAAHAADTSDTGITTDLQNFDAQLKATTQSSASVDQSFNDKPISQN